MPEPGKSDFILATSVENDWVRCSSCGRALFWVEKCIGIINIKCHSCKKIIRLALGVKIGT